jgi:F-type H+-transporting ATPase subunit alpha
MLGYIRSQHPEILATIKSSGKLGDDVKAKLDAALDAFAQIFQPTSRGVAA